MEAAEDLGVMVFALGPARFRKRALQEAALAAF